MPGEPAAQTAAELGGEVADRGATGDHVVTTRRARMPHRWKVSTIIWAPRSFPLWTSTRSGRREIAMSTMYSASVRPVSQVPRS